MVDIMLTLDMEHHGSTMIHHVMVTLTVQALLKLMCAGLFHTSKATPGPVLAAL